MNFDTLDMLYDTFEEYKEAVLTKLSHMEEDTTISDEAYSDFEEAVYDVLYATEYALNDTNDVDYINSLLDELFDLL